jgi:hypothetical protein
MGETRNNLTGKQKLALAGLAVFGFFVVVLWAADLRDQIRKPLSFESSKNSGGAVVQSEEEKLKSKDTDGDGLSDWDELNVYLTSPYLEDSDSDGAPDGTEIKNGTDPNCPQGKICASPVQSSGQTASTSEAGGASIPNLSVSSSTSKTDLSNMLSGQSDVSSLRKLLLDAGMDKATLDKISDEDLLKSYQDMVSSGAR